MRDYGEFRKIIEEIVHCTKCKECYRPSGPSLVYTAGDLAEIVFVSESPYNFPDDRPEFSRSTECYMKELNETLLGVKEGKGNVAKIHEFIYKIFDPIFSRTEADLAKLFSERVYWTHIGKKSFKNMDSGRRFKFGKMCAEKLIIQELSLIEPKLLIIVSSIATKVLFGLGFKELFNEHIRIDGELLDLNTILAMASCKSLMAQSRHKFAPDWTPKLAVLPNPSSTAARWHSYAYKKHERVAKNILTRIRESP